MGENFHGEYSEDLPKIKILSEKKPKEDVDVRILSDEFYDEQNKEIEDAINKIFGSQESFIESLRNYNQKLSEKDPNFSLKEKMAHLLADQSAKNQKEHRENDIDKMVKIIKPKKTL